MTTTTLDVTFCRTHDGKPLIQLHNLPGLDAELTPAELRALAAALIAAADDAALPSSGFRSYSLR